MEKYVVDGQGYNISPEDLQLFLEKYPNAVKHEEPGKTTDSMIMDPIGESNVMGSNLEDGSLGFIEKAKEGLKDGDINSIGEFGYALYDIMANRLPSAVKGGWAEQGGLEEQLELYEEGVGIDDETLQTIINNYNTAKNTAPSAAMEKFTDIYAEENKKIKEEDPEASDWWGFIKAAREEPGTAAELLVRSAAGQARAFLTSETARTKTLEFAVAGGSGALVLGQAGPQVGLPEELVTIPTAMYVSGIGKLSQQMEIGNTTIELLDEALEGEDFTLENVKKVLANEEKFQDIQNKSWARGTAIGTIEAITGGIAGKVARLAKPIGKLAQTGVAATTEAVGGGIGEFVGQKVAGQETDVLEIGFESFAGTARTPLSAGRAILSKKSKYAVKDKNGKENIVSYSQMKKFINTASNLEIAQADLIIENDNELAAQAYNKQNDAILETQVNEKVEDQADRKKMVDLEKQRVKADADSKKKGIQAVPGAKETLENIEMQMNEIVGKYTAIDARTKDVRARKKTAQDVRTRLDEISTEATRVAAAKTTATIKKQMEAVDKKTGRKGQVVEMSSEDIAESEAETVSLFEAEVEGYKQKLNDIKDKKSNEYKNTQSDLNFVQEQLDGIKAADKEFGYIVDYTDGNYDIILNKDKPMVGTAAHEFQHKILSRTLKNNTIIQDKVGVALTKYVTGKFGGVSPAFVKRMGAYINPKTGEQVSEFGEEIVTVMSESILDGSLKFNENLFTKIGGVVRQTLQRIGAIDVKFDTGRDVYNFIKDYNRSIEKDYVSKAITRMAVEGAKGRLVEAADTKAKETTRKMSKEASDNVQRIYEERGVDGAFDIIEEFKPIVSRIAEKRREAPNFDKELLMSEIEIGERGILDLISKYDPKSGVPLAAYINTYLPARAIEASRRVLGEEFTEDISERVDIAAEEVEIEVKAKPKKRKTILSDRLGVKNKVDKAIKEKLFELDIENLNFKTLKDQTPGITGEMFGISPKKLVSGANITKKELQSAQMFISKNADVLKAMLPEGATTGGTATGVPKTLLKEFYTKTDRAKMAKTGTKAGLAVQIKNDNISKKDFLEVFGIIDGKPVRTDRNTSARVLALASQTGKMMTNQAVRQELVNQGKPLQALGHIADGKATVMFSKSKQAIGTIDRSLSPEARILFWDDISTFANEDILDRSLESIKIGLRNTYGNISEINGKIDELAIALHKVIKNLKDPIIKNPIKLTEKLLETNNRALTKVREFFNSDVTAVDAFKDKQRVKNLKATTSVLTNKIFNPKNPGKSIAKILMMKGHLASASRDSYLARKQPFADNKEFSKATLSSIPGVTYNLVESTSKTGVVTQRIKNIKYNGVLVDVNNISSAQASQSALNDTKDDSKLEKRSKNEDIAQELLNETLGFYTELYNNGEIDNVDLMMVSASLLSNMNSVLARAAKLQYMSDNAFDFKNPGQELKYEHMQPRVAVLLNMWDAKINDDGISNVKDFLKNYTIQVIPNTMDDVITESQLGESLYLGQTLEMPSWIRTFNNTTRENSKGRLRPLININTKKLLKPSEAFVKGANLLKNNNKETKILNTAIQKTRTISFSKSSKGITVLDFDDTLATTKSLVKYTTPDGKTGTLNAEEYASTYQDLLEQGYTFDFTEFNKVVKGKLAPLFQKALKLQGKFGPENMFVLTARPMEAQKAIFDFLKANGLNIPIKNITGLGNSTAEAKALWMADKVTEGYNDFYFADDALQNVQAVKNMLDQFDVKSKVQQARVKFSKSMNEDFNNILENVTGIEAEKRFGATKARKRGADKGKFRFFIPPSHEDFAGLLYNFMGKGKQGDAHRNFFEQSLIKPLNRANREYDTARQSIANDYKALNKQFPDVKKKFNKKTPDGDFTYQDAIRIYLWDKHGHKVPGLSEIDQQSLVDLIKSDPSLQTYAETLNVISKQDTYVNPTEGWDSGDIRVDLDDATGRVGRADYFAEFNENTGVIFSEENLNKIEAGYGKSVREALEDMLYRIKTGRNRPSGQNAIVNRFMNYLNGSVGSVMFFNMRSALLQQMSLVNYINFSDNNIFSAAKAFANQPQYWKDWAFIFNSDMLKQRRGGIQTDVNGAELAQTLRKSKNTSRALISKLLELGFLPTQIGDNIAIATGGATYYRNRINKYTKEGVSKKEAETRAFDDLQEITQSTQQSARPDMVSQQQASPIGKVILNFQNVTSQFNRLGKKAFQDIYNRRITSPNKTQMQSDISNASRIAYYFAIQNAIFYTLQTALFAMLFDDDEDEDRWLKKKERVINGSIDSVLRGSGVMGAVISTLKNMAIKFAIQRDTGWNKDESSVVMEMLNVSPVVGIKARKITNAEKTLNYNKKVIDEMETFDIDNPQWSAVTNYIEATTNVPTNRLYNKTQNVRQSLNNQNAAWQRVLMFLGWSQYNLGIENPEIEKIKKEIKGKKQKKKSKFKTFKPKKFKTFK